mmetsp:Transcript_18093/g.51116  ORF Transcript_18093/g.51116 Transcript_18093/m.51116 type:complete len:214 (-) Transcript_18093:40-681(-)
MLAPHWKWPPWAPSPSARPELYKTLRPYARKSHKGTTSAAHRAAPSLATPRAAEVGGITSLLWSAELSSSPLLFVLSSVSVGKPNSSHSACIASLDAGSSIFAAAAFSRRMPQAATLVKRHSNFEALAQTSGFNEASSQVSMYLSTRSFIGEHKIEHASKQAGAISTTTPTFSKPAQGADAEDRASSAERATAARRTAMTTRGDADTCPEERR